MSNPVFTPGRIFTLVTFGALGGLVMGALFGVTAGLLTPTFFAHIIPWRDIEPVGFACVFGAFGGLFLGGGLAVFALLLHLALRMVSREKGGPTPPP